MHLVSSFFKVYDARVFEDGEVPRDRGDVVSDKRGQFSHAAFAAGEFIDDEEARRMRERLQYPRAFFEFRFYAFVHRKSSFPSSSILQFCQIAKYLQQKKFPE